MNNFEVIHACPGFQAADHQHPQVECGVASPLCCCNTADLFLSVPIPPLWGSAKSWHNIAYTALSNFRKAHTAHALAESSDSVRSTLCWTSHDDKVPGVRV